MSPRRANLIKALLSQPVGHQRVAEVAELSPQECLAQDPPDFAEALGGAHFVGVQGVLHLASPDAVATEVGCSGGGAQPTF